MTKKPYLRIVEHYEDCFKKHGDSHLGVDWPKETDALLRYKIMMGVIPADKRVSLLDFGCGAAHLYDYILKNNFHNIDYTGIDLSSDFIGFCKKKYPDVKFICGDILDDPGAIDKFDYIIMNGVFTEKRELSFDEMFDYFKKTIKTVFAKSNFGIAFNVMTKYVDWERDDLFHLSFDLLAGFLKKEVSLNYIIRNDYGLYEYTVYLFKEPCIWQK
jgi:SAM-dependent methyltransferase